MVSDNGNELGGGAAEEPSSLRSLATSSLEAVVLLMTESRITTKPVGVMTESRVTVTGAVAGIFA